MSKYKSYLDTYIEDLLNESRNIVASNINNMLKEQLSNPNYGNGNSECAGTYYVNGYTRKDGIEVEGYMRTCGAEHAGGESVKSFNTPILKDTITMNAEKKMDPDVTTQYRLAKTFGFASVLVQYYNLSLEFADKKSKNLKNKYNNDIYKFNETPDFVDKNYAFNKIKDSLELDMNYASSHDKIQNTRVVIPQENAEIINKIKKSPITAQMIKKYFDRIIDGETINTSIAYNQTNNFNEDSLYGVIKKADIRDLKVNEDGTISFYIVDMYDFERLAELKKGKLIQKIFTNANNRAHQQQSVGKLQPYLLYIPVTLSISEIYDMVND